MLYSPPDGSAKALRCFRGAITASLTDLNAFSMLKLNPNFNLLASNIDKIIDINHISHGLLIWMMVEQK
jgi:hypothetical protein